MTRQRERPQVMPVATLGQAAEALEAAHRGGPVHRDVKVAAAAKLPSSHPALVTACSGISRADRTEREVLELVAAGLGNHEIARRLVLSEKTVRNHVSAILVKLQVPDRASAVAKARDAGLGTNSQHQSRM
jgi:DNA-binding NarL/FixJ family response regulator